MTESGNQTPADRGNGIQILRVQEDLDLATAGALYQRGRTAIAGHARLLLLDLSGLSFCDARGLSALVRIANDADAAGCRYGLIAPQPQVAKILRITGLGTRLRAFATIQQARQRLTALAPLAARPHAGEHGMLRVAAPGRSPHPAGGAAMILAAQASAPRVPHVQATVICSPARIREDDDGRTA